MKNRGTPPVQESTDRAVLLRAIHNTYDDTRFLVSVRCSEEVNFLEALGPNRSMWYTKEQLLTAVEQSHRETFPDMKDHEEEIVISPALSIWKGSINESQMFERTPDAEDYERCVHNVHYDVYFRFDHEKKTVTFALGDRRKEIPLREHTGYSWKVLKRTLYCMDSEDLERSFRDPFWSQYMVRIGRKYLDIAPAV